MNIHKVYTFVKKIGRFQEKRMKKFQDYMNLTSSMRILDVGGYEYYWKNLNVTPSVTLLNVHPINRELPAQITSVIGDGRKLTFQDNSFDIAFSNSVIEHVGDYKDQKAFASELRRVAKRYYVQVPYRWAILEPHFLIFFFHWFPKTIYKKLVLWFSPWKWITKAKAADVDEMVDSINLLNVRQMKELFPDAKIERERFLGLTKSLIAIR